MGSPAVFLDRDGVIAESRQARGGPGPPRSVADTTIPDGTEDALRALRGSGFRLVVITNQPDVARGSATEAGVAAINDSLRDALALDAFYVCFHDGSECACRKPRPGLLLDATRDLDLDLARSWLIGDRWVDIAAGNAAGVQTVLIEREWSWAATSSGVPPDDLLPHATVTTIRDAAEHILRSSR